MSSGWRTIEPRQPGLAARLAESWQNRGLIRYFGRRFNQKRYLRTWLGPVWLILRPGFAIVPQLFVFGGVLKVTTGQVPYAITFVVGFTCWHLFAESAYWTTRSLELTRSMLRRMYVPRGTVIVAALVPALVDLVIVGAITVAVIVGYRVADGQWYVHLGWGTLMVLAGLVLLTLTGLGIGLWLSVPGASKRDIRFGLRFALNFWYFVTPVAYPLSQVPDSLRFVVELNPVTLPIQLVKIGLLHESGDSIPGLTVVSCAVFLSLLYAGGLWIFFRAEAQALDHI